MKKTFIILIPLLVVCLGIVGFIWMWRPIPSHREPPMSFKIKHQKIENEIAELKNHPWAGSYLIGDGDWMICLTLAPQNGFTLTERTCLTSDYCHGTVEWDGTRVSLCFYVPVPRIYDSEFTPIPWGERIYLVASDKIMDFCNAINSGDEPRPFIYDRRFFLREGNENKQTQGKPGLPEAFRDYPLDEPVEAAIVSLKDIQVWVSIKKQERQVATFVVDKGKNDGLLPGMVLYITGPGNIYQQGEIKRVEETSSVWTVDFGGPYFFPRGGGKRDILRSPDGWEHWRLSTRPKRGE